MTIVIVSWHDDDGHETVLEPPEVPIVVTGVKTDITLDQEVADVQIRYKKAK